MMISQIDAEKCITTGSIRGTALEVVIPSSSRNRNSNSSTKKITGGDKKGNKNKVIIKRKS